MSTTYRAYELNEYLETPWFDREIALFTAIIDKLPEADEDYVSTEHYHAKLASPDGTVDPGLLVDASGLTVIGNGKIAAASKLLDIFLGDSGVTPNADVGAFMEEADADLTLGIGIDDTYAGGLRVQPVTGDGGSILFDDDTSAWRFGIDDEDDILRIEYTDMILRIIDGGVLAAGGSAGLRLEDDGGHGVTIVDGGGLYMDTSSYLQFGFALINSESVYIAYDLMPCKNAAGNVVYLLARTTT